MTIATQQRSDSWEIRSEIDGRLRIYHPGLSSSLGLRRHCASVLHRTHWLISHRINVVSSTVVLRFPSVERDHCIALLTRCFIDPFTDQNVESALSRDNQITDIVERPPFRDALRSGVICASILALDSLFVIPPLTMAVLATFASFPLIRHTFHALRKRCSGDSAAMESLLSSSVELTLSSALIGSGLARELFVDELMGHSTSAIRSISQDPEGRSREFYDFIGRLKRNIQLTLVEPSSLVPFDSQIALGDISAGQLYNIKTDSHVFLHSRLIKGELLVVNTLVDGSTLPYRLLPGDEIQFGTYVLQGDALCKVLDTFEKTPVLTIHDANNQSKLRSSSARSQKRYRAFASPLQLGFGLWSLLGGFTERAIAVLAFDPFKDIQSSNLSSGETALVDMALNQVHMSDALTISSLSCVDHVLFSINTLRHLGDFQLREEAIHSDCAKGDLIHMLYSVAVAMHADPAMVFWGVLAETDLKPLSVSFLNVSAGWICESMYVVSFDGKEPVSIKFEHGALSKELENPSHDIKISFASGKAMLGTLLIRWSPDPELAFVIKQLHSLGLKTEVVGGFHAADSKEPTLRHQRVIDLQRSGATVAYLGDVIDDIPAMASADLAIGLSEDDTGFISKTVCDVILGGDLMWLSRLIALSRRYVSATDVNSSIILVTSVATSLATLFAGLTPLQAIVLFRFAPIAAEINTLLSLNPNASRVAG